MNTFINGELLGTQSKVYIDGNECYSVFKSGQMVYQKSYNLGDVVSFEQSNDILQNGNETWLKCNGQFISELQYPSITQEPLFSILKLDGSTLTGQNMTSNVLPSPYIASTSSFYGTAFDAWKAFDGNRITPSYWNTAAGQLTSWLAFDFGANNTRVINSILLDCGTNTVVPTIMPKNFNVVVTTHNGNSEIVLSVYNETWLLNDAKQYYFNSVIPRKIQINITNYVAQTNAISEIQFGSPNGSTLYKLPIYTTDVPNNNVYIRIE